MAKIIHTDIIIKASQKKIWKILTDFSKFPKWNPFIKEISGNLAIGEGLKVTISPPNGASMKFRPKIIELMEEKSLIWKGKFLLPGLFDGEHRFILEKNGENSTKFIQEEIFTGILTYMMPQSIWENTKAGFTEMNLALKKTCEK